MRGIHLLGSDIMMVSWVQMWSYRSESSLCSSGVMYLKCNAKSNQTADSVVSESESVNLLTKFFGYFRLRQASAMFAHTESDERRIWSVRLYFSSDGNDFVIS